METTTLGSSGIEISALGFGGMRLPAVDESQAMATLEKALELGITLFETGWGYGKGSSEACIGRAVAGRRDGVTLCNKASVGPDVTRENVREQMQRSLESERTDRFETYSLWGVNNHEIFESCRERGLFEEIRKMRDEGLARLVGVTTHAQPDEVLEFIDAEEIQIVTLKYNMLSRRHEPVLAELARRGIACLVMSPLAGGMIADPGEAMRAEIEAAGLTPAVLGLRYHTSNPGVSCPIAGMNTPEMVAENVAAGTKAPLTETEKRLVGKVQEALTTLGEDFCTGCGYCVPCPEGVGIPSIFALWNMQRVWGSDSYTKLEYLKMREQRHWADFRGKDATHCADCGECEEKCPNSLPVREMLKKAHEELM